MRYQTEAAEAAEAAGRRSRTMPAPEARARQDLLREVRAQSSLLLQRTERCGCFHRPSIGELARVELQASLRDPGSYVARHCIVLLACAVDDGAAVPSDIVECCREAVERSGDAAVRTLFLVCLRRLAGPGRGAQGRVGFSDARREAAMAR